MKILITGDLVTLAQFNSKITCKKHKSDKSVYTMVWTLFKRFKI